MSDNGKREEKWTFYFRDDQCRFISEALLYIVTRVEERIAATTTLPFDKFTSEQVKAAAQEIVKQIADATT